MPIFRKTLPSSAPTFERELERPSLVRKRPNEEGTYQIGSESEVFGFSRGPGDRSGAATAGTGEDVTVEQGKWRI
jgi:hypothetical protein